MIGSNVAGWIVSSSLDERDGFRRYAVRHTDGRAGVMEIAAAGSPAAMSLVQRAGNITALDRGYDSYGNPFVVVPAAPQIRDPFAAPRAEPAVRRIEPATPAKRSRRKLWVGLGAGVLALVAVNVAVRAGETKPKRKAPPFGISAKGSWGIKCNAPYTLTVDGPADSTVDVLGRHLRIEYRGAVETTFTEAELAGVTSIAVHAMKDDDAADATVALGAEDDRRAVIDDGKIFSRKNHIYGAQAAIDDSKDFRMRTSLSSPYNADGESLAADGHAVFSMAVCNLAVAGAAPPGTTAAIENNRLKVDVDLAEIAWRAPGDKEPSDFAVAVPVMVRGRAAKLTIKVDHVSAKLDDTYRRVVDIAKTPIPDAPLPADTPAPRPLLVRWSHGLVERKYLGTAAPAAAPYIVLVEGGSDDVGSCGPYGTSYSYQYVPRSRATASVKVYEARTSKLVAQRRLAGSVPSCPQSVTTYNGKASGISGDGVDDALDKWLEQFRN